MTERIGQRWLGLGVGAFLVALCMGGCFPTTQPDDGTDAGTDLPTRTTLEVTASSSTTSASVGETVTLTAAVSTDVASVIYGWLQTAGSGVAISAADTAEATFTAPSLQNETTLTFVVTVSDDANAVGQATVSVTVAADPNYGIDPNDPTRPQADAGADVSEAELVDLKLSGSDSSGLSLKYRWQQTAGADVTIVDPNLEEIEFETPEFVSDGDNTLGFRLTVRDEQGRTNSDDVQVTVTAVSQPRVQMGTSLGDIVIELNETLAPLHTANFLQYVDGDFYPGTIFHRVVNGPDFYVVQGGGFDVDLEQKDPNDPVRLEADNGLLNVAGTIAAARTSDPNSATSQFYFNPKDNTAFDPENNPPGYTVFGRVIRGFDVVLNILEVDTSTQSGFENVPVTPVTIDAVERVDK